jgi:ABC-2 type transport system permease protein
MKEIFYQSVSLAQRDILKFTRDRGRMLASFIFPMVFLAIFATTLDAGIGKGALGFSYVEYVFSGLLLQSVFQSSFMGIVSLIADREKDFSMSIFVSPANRLAIVLGKILGEMFVGLGQIGGIILIGIFLGVGFHPLRLLMALPLLALAGFVGGSFGILVASRINTAENAQRIFPFLMFPLMFLSGAFTPVRNLPLILNTLKSLNPIYYGVDLMRHWLYQGKSEIALVTANVWWLDLLVFTLLGVICLFVGTWLFTQKEGNR